ncbi:MAG: carbohydrate ABC transporter permease [Symbiobacterium sp.]|uniref:carbohydrate ABC transporter permease n=1 Tax=Symbiobacterium sp. TaxID=1971213 RepID=UPI0034644036
MSSIRERAREPLSEKTTRVLVIVLFSILVVIAIYPIIWLVINSFKSNVELFTNSMGLPKTLRWANYERAWRFGIARYMVNSVVVTAATTFLVALLSTMAAYALSRFRFRGQGILLYIVLGGLMLAPEVSLIPLFRILVVLRIYNTYFAMILPIMAFGIPFTTFLIRAYMLGLPKDFEEAAVIDGANALGIFRHVIVPLSRPIIASAALLQAMHVWNEFMFSLTFIESDRLKTLPIGIMAFSSTLDTNWPVVIAGLVMTAVPMIVLFLLTQRAFIRGLTAGGVKG